MILAYLVLSGFSIIVVVFSICHFLPPFIFQMSYSQLSHSSWSNKMNMPTPRSEIAATNIEGNIFVIGGFDESGKALATVESYNVFNDSWKSITPLPEPMHHTTASTY